MTVEAAKGDAAGVSGRAASAGAGVGVVGRPARRIDGIAKVTGQARYPADIYLPDMLYGMTLRSKYPYARILRIDTSRAAHVPGVCAVLTGKDVPGENSHGVLFQDQPVLADKIVKSAADPIAVVAAESREAAAEAIELIQVEYEELTPIFDPVAAMQPGAPQLHEDWPGNILHHQRIRKGDVEKGFARADVIIENTYTTQMTEHLFLQPEAAVARVDERGHVVIQVATQYPHYDRTAVARILGVGVNQVRIVATAIGGAFGAREDLTLQGHAALLAWKTRRPVKMVYSREESVLAHCKRHPMIMKYKTGATKDGKLTALEATIIGNTGAYASWGINILRKAAVHATGPYEIPNVAVDAYAVFTNIPFAGAMRGFGAPQPAIAYEGQMDEIAAALGIHPFTIRVRNALQVGSMTGTGQLLESSVGLKETLRRAAEAFRLNVAGRGTSDPPGEGSRAGEKGRDSG
ncbi:MAG: xanthine dehydrogenase family protein molybdopterin-binding subunit [Syntrophothermus sp.]